MRMTEKWYEEQRSKQAARKKQQEEDCIEKAIKRRQSSDGTFCSWLGEPKAMGVAKQEAAIQRAAQNAEDVARQKAAQHRAKMENERLDQVEAQTMHPHYFAAAEPAKEGVIKPSA